VQTPDTDLDIEERVTSWLTLPDCAEALGIDISRARQLVAESALLAVRRGESRVLMVPSSFIDNDVIVKHLTATIRLLSDSGFTAKEALIWLFTEQDGLSGAPIDALRENRGREVKRRAQASAW
jgi:hypothetical protein